MNILILRFDGPLMSFGGVMVDQHGVIDRFPGLSFLTGLFANALGFSHGDSEVLNSLQNRILYAARWDVSPEKIIDYHTVDLGQEKMSSPGWTTRGIPEHRAGGPDARLGTHQRYRHYWANGVMTVAVSLLPDGTPSVTELSRALTEPARPLFLGRKTCIPSSPILMATLSESNVVEALKKVPPSFGHTAEKVVKLEACWPNDIENSNGNYRLVKIYDRRDWKTQLHTGSRLRAEGVMEVICT
jgi:CRISPR system Cascade subunit CasD